MAAAAPNLVVTTGIPGMPGMPGMPGVKAGAKPLPTGAAKMQPWYINGKGMRIKTNQPVPVDSDDHRTKHVLHGCAKGTCVELDWLLAEDGKRFCRVHGQQLVAKTLLGDKRVAAERRKALAREARVLHGASALPWLALLVLFILGVVVEVAHVPAWQPLVALLPVDVAAYLIAQWRIRAKAIKLGRVERGQTKGRQVDRIHTAAARVGTHFVAALLWLALVAIAPAPPALVGIALWLGGVAGWALSAYPWWSYVDARRSRGTPTPPPAPTVPAARVVTQAEAEAVRVWRARMAKPGGGLPGTDLVDYQTLPACAAGGPDRERRANWCATVRATEDGSINMRANRPDLVGRIAAAYGVSYGDVSFAADENDVSIAYVRVQPDNPLAEVRMFDGITVDDWVRGWSAVGWHDDGAPIRYVWWTESGTVHDLISGCTGSGKSEVVAQLLIISLHSGGLAIDWLGDPQSGQSYGALKRMVDYFAVGIPEIQLMLLAALTEMLRRNEVLSERDVKTWKPTVDMPLLTITLDEVQSFIEDAAIQEMIEKLVGMGRKVGIKLRLLTQVPAVGNLGGSTYIKEQLKAGQSITFRAATDVAGRLAVDGDSPIDPTLLPARWGKFTCGYDKTTAGLCFVQGIYGRDVYGRVAYTGEDMAVWLFDNSGTTTTSPGRFDDAAITAGGVVYTGRHERAALAAKVGRSPADMLTGGKAIELLNRAQEIADGGYKELPAIKPAGQAQPFNGGDFARGDILAVIRAIVVEHPDGIAVRKAIIAATPGMATSTRDRVLGELVDDGVITRVKQGQYRLTEKPAAATDLDDVEATEGGTE